VLCFGADGHVAIEPAHDHRSEARPKRERVPDAEAASSTATAECKPCFDLPVVSEDHGAHKPLVAHKAGSFDVKAAPEAVIAFVSFDGTSHAALVITRQRPGTPTGVVLVTLEDETSCLNLIVWSRLVDRQRKELLGSRLLGVIGEMQSEGEVVHILARHLEDHSPPLRAPLDPAAGVSLKNLRIRRALPVGTNHTSGTMGKAAQPAPHRLRRVRILYEIFAAGTEGISQTKM